MTEQTLSWLYGPSQPQECPFCAVPVLPGERNMSDHLRYWCDARHVEPDGTITYRVTL